MLAVQAEGNWLRTARIFAFESWWPPFWPHLEVDWHKSLWTMRRLHLDTLQANALMKWACYPTDTGKPLAPAIAVKWIGEGRVIFSSVAWGRQYLERHDPSLGGWMRDMIAWLGHSPVPVQVDGSRLIHLGATPVDDGWLLYLVNQSNDVQGRRQDWWEMMKVAERPLPVGPAEVFVRDGRPAEKLYGPEPDPIPVRNGGLKIS